jgi:hypothetical protein
MSFSFGSAIEVVILSILIVMCSVSKGVGSNVITSNQFLTIQP